jgi:hypothetical protein
MGFEDDTKVGAVKRFEVANVGHVIATLKNIDDSGLTPISQARAYVDRFLKIRKGRVNEGQNGRNFFRGIAKRLDQQCNKLLM